MTDMSTRPPKGHNWAWSEILDEDDEFTVSPDGTPFITPRERARRALTAEMEDLKEYDIVFNDSEGQYRNEGAYIYYNGGLHMLSLYPDDYGSLPEWVVVRKEDCGYSYFNDGLVSHNSFVPFSPSDWTVGETKCYVEYSKIYPTFSPHRDLFFETRMVREEDGATAVVRSSLTFSAPWFGGLERDAKSMGGEKSGPMQYSDYEYENGETLTITQDHQQWPPEHGQQFINISGETIKEAESLVNQRFRSRFGTGETIYFDCTGPCQFSAVIPVFWRGNWSNLITTVVPLPEP